MTINFDSSPETMEDKPKKENIDKKIISFAEGIQLIKDFFNSKQNDNPIIQTIKEFCKENLPNIPLSEAITICYQIASVDLPESPEFALAPLVIEETKPSEYPVLISEVVQKIKGFLQKHVIAEPSTITVLTYYVLITWFCNHLNIAPYLFITSGAPGSGKSTVAKSVAHLCYRPCMMSSASSVAALSRVCGRRPCTIMIDELDSASIPFIQETTAILNSGSGGSGDVARLIVERSPRGRQQVAALRSFGPKILVGLSGPTGLRALQPATLSRCIVITCSGTGQFTPAPLPPFRKDLEASEMRRELATVAEAYGEKFLMAMRNFHALDNMPHRTRDKMLPLMTAASLVEKENNSEKCIDSNNIFRVLMSSPRILTVSCCRRVQKSWKMY